MQVHGVPVVVEGAVRMIMWLKVWHRGAHNRTCTVPLQRTARGYTWCTGGHVIDVCLHRRTVSVYVQRHEHMIMSDDTQHMIKCEVTSPLPRHLMTCLDCPSVACLPWTKDERSSSSFLDPHMTIYPVAQRADRTGPVQSSPGPVQSSPR